MRRALLLILVAGAVTYAVGLGNTAFWDKHWESRRALIARTMLEDGDFLVPHQNGTVTLKKPPLYYWIVAGSMQATGNREELGARLPSAAAGVLGLALTWRLGVLLAGPAAGCLAALCLLVNVLYFGHARTAEMDMVLLAVETAALWAFFEARAARRRAVWAALGWALLAAGFLIKGPVGVLVPLVVVLVYVIADRRSAAAPSAGWVMPWRGLALFAILAVPWFLVVWQRLPHALAVFREETLVRYGGKLDHPEPFWFYVPVLLAGFLPGSLYLPSWVRAAREPEAGKDLRRLAVAVLVLVLFFSLSGAKRIYYVLPLWPLLALGIGIPLARSGRSRVVTAATIGLALLLVAAALVALFWTVLGGEPFFTRTPLAVALLAGVGLAAVAAAVAAFRGAIRGAAGGVIGAFLLAQVFYVAAVAPRSDAYRSRKDFARAVAQKVPAGEPLYMLGDQFALVFYSRRTIPFIYDDDDLPAVVRSHGSIHLICEEKQAERLRSEGYRVERELHSFWKRGSGRARDLSLVRVSSEAP